MSLTINYNTKLYLALLPLFLQLVTADNCLSNGCTAWDYDDQEHIQSENNIQDDYPALQCYECYNRKDCVEPRIVNCSMGKAEHTRRIIHTLMLKDYEPLEERNKFFYKCITLDWQNRGGPAEIIRGCYYWLPQYNYSVKISAYAFCHKCHNNLCNTQPQIRSYIWRSLKQFVNNLFIHGEMSRKLFSRKRRPKRPAPLELMANEIDEKIATTTARPTQPPRGIRGLQECF